MKKKLFFIVSFFLIILLISNFTYFGKIEFKEARFYEGTYFIDNNDVDYVIEVNESYINSSVIIIGTIKYKSCKAIGRICYRTINPYLII